MLFKLAQGEGRVGKKKEGLPPIQHLVTYLGGNRLWTIGIPGNCEFYQSGVPGLLNLM